MAKMRVYEYAKAINVSSKEILTALKNMDIVVNNHMAMLEERPLSGLMRNLKRRRRRYISEACGNEQKQAARD